MYMETPKMIALITLSLSINAALFAKELYVAQSGDASDENPGGIDFYAAPDCRPKWSHFNYPPNRCSVLWDAEGTGVPDILVGREDGYITRYRVEDGRATQSVFVGPEARDLTTIGGRLVAASSSGLTLLDAQLRTVDFIPRPADAVASVGEQLAVAFSDGNIVRYEVEAR